MSDKELLNDLKELASNELDKVTGGIMFDDSIRNVSQVTPEQFSNMLPDSKDVPESDGKPDTLRKIIHPGT